MQRSESNASPELSPSGTPPQPQTEPFNEFPVSSEKTGPGTVTLFQDRVAVTLLGETVTVPNPHLHAVINVLDAAGFITLKRPHAQKPTIDATGSDQ